MLLALAKLLHRTGCGARWSALLLALAAGKDVFCEKPTLTIAQGRQLADEVAKRNAVFQTGLEDRSIILRNSGRKQRPQSTGMQTGTAFSTTHMRRYIDGSRAGD